MKIGDLVNTRVDLPKHFIWNVFGRMIEDLGISDDYPDVCHAVRHRSYANLMSSTQTFEPRCMLEEQSGENKFEFFVRYQMRSFLRKYPFPGNDTATPALMKFIDAEKQCDRYNRENYKAIERLSADSPEFSGTIERIRKDIALLIGETPDLSYVFGHARHGPGVCVGVDKCYRDGRTTNFYKFRSLPYTVTTLARPYAKQLIASDPRWMGALDDWYRKKTNNLFGPIAMDHFWDSILVTHDRSTLFSVPKTAEIDRFAAKEAVMNVMLQLGVDAVMRSRLKRWGYDIDDQTLNQELAEVGSLGDDLSTLDMSAASDTISLRVCLQLLPPGWFDLLVDLRTASGDYKVNGKNVMGFTFSKMSSMGNGFTFALETLIFGAIVREAIRKTNAQRCSAVYGDDLVVPRAATARAIQLLELFGFTINQGKSFTDGPFRESCGKDYLSGTDVRPLFITSRVQDITDLFYLHNALIALERRLPWYFDIRFKKTCGYIRSRIPKHIRDVFYGPPTDTLDTYLFSRKKLEHKDKHGRTVFFKIQPTAVVRIRPRIRSSKHATQFFFLKLLATLGRKMPKRFWEKRSRDYSTGNCFYVTRRGKVTHKCVTSVADYQPATPTKDYFAAA